MKKIIRLLAKLPYYLLGLFDLLGSGAVFLGVILGILTQSERMMTTMVIPGFIVLCIFGSATIEKMIREEEKEKKEVTN